MKSPFPGLDPYLEKFWSNVHTSAMTYLRDQIQANLPDGLWAHVEESLMVNDPFAERPRIISPDIHVTEETSEKPGWFDHEPGGVTVAEPVVIVDEDYPTHRHIEIIDVKSGREVVTSIEVLSPSNKIGFDQRAAYRKKQQSVILARISLIEIDLIRSGQYVLSVPWERIPKKKQSEYLISVYRANIPLPEWEVYPVYLRNKLPAFRIPLRPGDADIILDLQPVLDQCYKNGGYHIGIDYTKPPVPKVSKRDRDWVKERAALGAT